MNIIFPSVDENFIKAKINNGFYSNATELVRDAVRRLREQDRGADDRLASALEAGEQAIREGKTETCTPKLLTRLKKEAIRDAAKGRKPKSDVCD